MTDHQRPEALRAQFEREFGKLPYEFELSRFPETGAWAGQYTSLKTQCGWEGYQAGHAAAKAETAAAVAAERERATDVLAAFIPEWDGQEAVDGGDLIRMLIGAIRSGAPTDTLREAGAVAGGAA